MAGKAPSTSRSKKTLEDRFGRRIPIDQVAKAISSSQGLSYEKVVEVLDVFKLVNQQTGVSLEELLPALIRRLDPARFDIHMGEMRLAQSLYGKHVHSYICVNPHSGAIKRGLCYPLRPGSVPENFPGRRGWAVKQDKEIDEWIEEYGRTRVEKWCVFLL